MKKTIRILILLAIPIWWLGMISSLWARTQEEKRGLSYLSSTSVIFNPLIGTSWYSIEKDGQQTGYMKHTLLEIEEDDQTPFVIEESSAMYATIGSEHTPVVLAQRSYLDDDFKMIESTGQLALGTLSFELSSRRQNERIVYTLSDANSSQTFESEATGATSFAMYLTLASMDMQPGAIYEFETFNPLSQTPLKSTIEFLGDDPLLVADETVQARSFRVSSFGLSSTIWIDAKGTLIREQSSDYTVRIADFAQIKNIYQQLGTE